MTRKTKSERADAYVQVAVMAAVRDPLTYRAPRSLEIRPGQRVLVPLGSRKAIGIALEPRTGMAPGLEAREIIRVLDPEPILSPELLTLGLWIAEYYLAPVGEVFRAMLPLRPETRPVRTMRLTEQGKKHLDLLTSCLLAEVRDGEEARLLAYLRDRPDAALETVRRKFAGVSSALLAKARKKGWIAEDRKEQDRRNVMAVRLARPFENLEMGGRKLSPAARRILEALREQEAAFDHRELLKTSR